MNTVKQLPGCIRPPVPYNNAETYLDKTLTAAKKLVNLLEDPHPGLMTWNVAVMNQADIISKELAID
jgi:hypothetical protein